MTLTLLIRAGTGVGASFTSVTQPRYSPDGLKVAFLADTGIWTIRLSDNNLVHVSARSGATWPNWAPDSAKLVYQADTVDGRAIYRVNADGSSDTLIVPASNLVYENYLPSYAPDGTVIYTRGDDVSGQGDLRVCAADGSGDALFLDITPPSNAVANEARWSHDQGHVAFEQSNSSADGGHVVDSGASGDVALGVDVQGGMDWSLDDSTILIKDPSVATSLSTIKPDGTDLTVVYDNPALVSVSCPSYSPDDTKIAFAGQEVDAFDSQQLWLLDVSGPTQPSLSDWDCETEQATITGVGFTDDPGLVVLDPHGDVVAFTYVSKSDTTIVIHLTDFTMNGLYSFTMTDFDEFTGTLACDVPPPTPGEERGLIRRTRRFPLPFDRNLFVTVWRLEMLMQMGIGRRVGDGLPGQDPAVEIRLSTDGGETWGPTMIVTAGRQGQRTARAIINRLGAVQNGYIEISVADPVAWGFYQAVVDAEFSEP